MSNNRIHTDFAIIMGLDREQESCNLMLSDKEPDLVPPTPSPEPKEVPNTPKCPKFGPKTNKQSSYHTIRTRIAALLIYENKGGPIAICFEKIELKYGVIKSIVYKIKTKAIAAGWSLSTNRVLESFIVNNKPKSRRKKISTALVKFILATITKNSITRGQSCAYIVYEISETPGQQKVSASIVYYALSENGYSVFKRIIKPGLKDTNIIARLNISVP